MARQLSTYCCTLLLHQDQRSQLHERNRPLTWSPLTESNRRPSPYYLGAWGLVEVVDAGQQLVVVREG